MPLILQVYEVKEFVLMIMLFLVIFVPNFLKKYTLIWDLFWQRFNHVSGQRAGDLTLAFFYCLLFIKVQHGVPLISNVFFF